MKFSVYSYNSNSTPGQPNEGIKVKGDLSYHNFNTKALNENHIFYFLPTLQNSLQEASLTSQSQEPIFATFKVMDEMAKNKTKIA